MGDRLRVALLIGQPSEIGITGQLEALARFSHGLEAAVASSTKVNAGGILQIHEWSPTSW